VIPLSPEAEAQLDALLVHYEKLDRVEAARNLLAALEKVSKRIERSPELGLSAPRPYPLLSHLGFRWIKEGGYWIAYTHIANDLIIAGVFHETADIPNRV
jgi:plasmid stabilization system protein ParE